MIIKTEIYSLEKFEAWSGAVYTKEKIIDAGKGELFMQIVEDIFPDGATDTQLNDLLWHDSTYCFELVGLDENGDVPEEEEEEEEEENKIKCLAFL